MGHWNYRVMKRISPEGKNEYGIYEVSYDDAGTISVWTKNPITPPCSSLEELHADLEQMMAAFDNEVLDYH